MLNGTLTCSPISTSSQLELATPGSHYLHRKKFYLGTLHRLPEVKTLDHNDLTLQSPATCSLYTLICSVYNWNWNWKAEKQGMARDEKETINCTTKYPKEASLWLREEKILYFGDTRFYQLNVKILWNPTILRGVQTFLNGGQIRSCENTWGPACQSVLFVCLTCVH